MEYSVDTRSRILELVRETDLYSCQFEFLEEASVLRVYPCYFKYGESPGAGDIRMKDLSNIERLGYEFLCFKEGRNNKCYALFAIDTYKGEGR